MTMAAELFIGLNIIYLALCIWIWIFQRSQIFKPTIVKTNKELLEKFRDYEFSIEHEGIKLFGLFKKSGEECIIIYYGGTGEDITFHFNKFDSIVNASLLFMDYRGYCKSEGVPSEKGIYSDSLYLFDYVTKNQTFKKVILVGRSLGSAVAAYVASKRSASAIILITPSDSIIAIARNRLPFVPMSLLLRHKFDSLKLAPQITAPTLVLRSENDLSIKSERTDSLLLKLPNIKKCVTIKESDHSSIKNFETYWGEIKKFIEESAI
jgi:uncharacterized protein